MPQNRRHFRILCRKEILKIRFSKHLAMLQRIDQAPNVAHFPSSFPCPILSHAE
jgi:hypothetical protein